MFITDYMFILVNAYEYAYTCGECYFIHSCSFFIFILLLFQEFVNGCYCYFYI